MKLSLSAAVLLSAITLSGGIAAHAADGCQGKVVIDTVYQKGSGGKFEYYFQLRNATSAPIRANVEVGQFPEKVSIFSRNLPGITLDPHANRQIRFGTGSDSQINDGTVKKYYDTRMSLNAPFVFVSGCK